MDDLIKILPGLANSFPGSEKIQEAVVFAIWKKAAGEGLRNHAIPLTLEGTKMRIAVRDAIWKNHLEKLAPQLIERTNRLMDSRAVTYLVFEVDESYFPADAAGKERSNLPEVKTGSVVAGNLERRSLAIRDPKLRKLFLEAAASYLGGQLSRR